MRILVAAPTATGTAKVGLNLATAFAELGHTVEVFDYDKRPWWLAKIPKALRTENWRAHCLQWANEKLLATATRFHPELFLCVKGLQLFPETIRKISASGAQTAGYWIDDPLDHARSLQNASAYDIYFTNDRQSVESYRAENVRNTHYLPSAVDTQLFRPLPTTAHGMDFSFVGTHSDYRERLLGQFDDPRLSVFGPGWPKNSQLRHCIRHPAVFGDGTNRLFNETRINLNIHNWFGQGTAMNLRLFEVPAAGGFLLSDWVEEIDSHFTDERHLVCWRSVDELHDKAEFYLRHDSLRQKIAEEGYRHVLANHTYQQRALLLLALARDS